MRTSNRARTCWGAAIAMVTAISAAGAAEDRQGCKEHEGFKRMEGSNIVLCDYRKFDEYVLPTGKVIDSEDFTSKVYTEKRNLEGKVDKNLYLVPAGPSTAEVARNYENMLTGLGYTLIYQARGSDELGLAFDVQFGKSFKDLNALLSFNMETWRFDAYVKDEGDTKRYVAVHAAMTDSGVHPDVQTSAGDIAVRVDTILVGSLKPKMEAVKASAMKKAIDEFGRISLYGINFDFNKADIKPESRPVLDEIGKFLKDYPDEKLVVVGHTDNVGGAEFNLGLSEARANAVVKDLVASYGIDAARLQAQGAGLTKPVASNDSEEGRAKNRRVELVKGK